MTDGLSDYVCFSSINFVKDKQYKQYTLQDTETLAAAQQKCELIADGSSFFVQKHTQSEEVICGVHETPLEKCDVRGDKSVLNGGQDWGSVCLPLKP